METLVEIAKRIGIKPNLHMNEQDWADIRVKIGQELAKIPTGLSADHPKEKYRHSNPLDLFNNLYHVRKRMERNWPVDTAENIIQIMSKTNNEKEIFAHAQILGFQSLEESPFIHHHALNRQKPIKERFVADINIASPDFPSLIKKMDDFILKYNAQFKVVNQRALNRSDTMNVYMQENITSQIAEEFYKIVKPCLCKDNHDKLDGFEIMQGSTPIKGIKIGPELDENKQAYLNRKRWVNKTLARDIHSPALREKAENYLEKLIAHSSLGEKACSLQLMDLMYYAMDRGPSPFHYISYDGSFYDKKLIIPNNEEKSIERAPLNKEPKQSFWKRLFTKKKKKSFHWDDPIKWKDVMTTSSDGKRVNFGHRINISTLTEEERTAFVKASV